MGVYESESKTRVRQSATQRFVELENTTPINLQCVEQDRGRVDHRELIKETMLELV